MQKIIQPIVFVFLSCALGWSSLVHAKPETQLTSKASKKRNVSKIAKKRRRLARKSVESPKRYKKSKKRRKYAKKRKYNKRRKYTKKRKYTKRRKRIARSMRQSSSNSPKLRKNKRRKYALSVEDQAELDTALKKIGLPAKSTRPLRNKDFQIPHQLGAFPIPRPLAARVRFWYQVFGGALRSESILYDPKTHIIVKNLHVPGAALSPEDPGILRRVKTLRRRAASAHALVKIRAQLKELARREKRAEADAKNQARTRQRQCFSLLRKKRLRAICWHRTRYDDEHIDRARWQRSFSGLDASTKSLYRSLQREARYHTNGWNKMFRYLANTRLSWQSSYRYFFQRGLRIERQYRPHIQAALRKAGLPPQLSALPFVESMYNPWVRSFVGALGLWQLMPDTAKELGLFVPSQNKSIPHRKLDERFDPIFATRAASRFIKLCRHFFPRSWPLAITSYNQGPGRILKEARRLGTKKLHVIIARSRNRGFGFDGRNFYAKFLASALLIRDNRRHFRHVPQTPIHFREILTLQPLWLEDLLRATKLSKQKLDLYNPMLRRLLEDPSHPIPAYFPLRVPPKKAKAVKRALRKLYQKGPSRKQHITQKRENLYRIAKQYNVTLAALLQTNAPSITPAQQKAFTAALKKKKRTTHKSLRVLCSELKNRKIPYKIRSLAKKHCPKPLSASRKLPKGLRLSIPAQRIAAAHNAPLTTYRTRGGEPLAWVACQVCTTSWHLRSLNPSIPIGRLPAGKALRVPSCSRWRKRMFKSCHSHHYKRSARKKRRSRKKRRRRRR